MEIWRPIRGYEDCYAVSDLGRVKSLERRVPSRWDTPRLVPERILAHEVDKDGYHRVGLWRHAIGRRVAVHILVLETFVGPRPPGMSGLHWDDDPDNNRLSNLRWGTNSENRLDEVRNGGNPNARKTHCPRGHALGGPNLVRRAGHRECLACSRANALCRKRGVPFDAVLADEKYRDILRG